MIELILTVLPATTLILDEHNRPSEWPSAIAHACADPKADEPLRAYGPLLIAQPAQQPPVRSSPSPLENQRIQSLHSTGGPFH